MYIRMYDRMCTRKSVLPRKIVLTTLLLHANETVRDGGAKYTNKDASYIASGSTMYTNDIQKCILYFFLWKQWGCILHYHSYTSAVGVDTCETIRNIKAQLNMLGLWVNQYRVWSTSRWLHIQISPMSCVGSAMSRVDNVKREGWAERISNMP